MLIISISSAPRARDGRDEKLLFIPTLFRISGRASSPKNRCVLTAYTLSE